MGEKDYCRKCFDAVDVVSIAIEAKWTIKDVHTTEREALHRCGEVVYARVRNARFGRSRRKAD